MSFLRVELFQMALIKRDHDCVSAVSIATDQQPRPAVTPCPLLPLCQLSPLSSVTHKFMMTLQLRTVSYLQNISFFLL